MNIAFPSCPPLEGVRGRIRIARGAIPTTTSTSGGHKWLSLSGRASFSCRLWRGLHYCPPLEGGLCHNAEWSLRDASQASWQSPVFGYLGDCFSRCCSFAMTLRHSLKGPGGGFGLLGEQSLQQPPPAEEDRDTSTSSATFELEPFAFVLDPCIMSLSGGGQGEVTTTTSAGRG